MKPSSGTHVLLVTKMDADAPPGGREQLYHLNRACLESLFGPGFHCRRVADRSPRTPRAALRALCGYVDGVDRHEIDRIVEAVDSGAVTKVFIDGSNLGQIARGLKRRCPQVTVYTFFHNVEARFFLGALRTRRSLRALAVLIANYTAERMAVRHSDVLICLSRRDRALLKKIYGRAADHVAPMALADKLPAPPPPPGTPAEPPYLLFVGGGFYANRMGIRWFAEAVAPRIPMKTRVVGYGLDVLATEFAGNDRVEVLGAVDDLTDCYLGAYAVIAPIFDGSGMKTKVAEAMMFGKRIIGTEEAFSGYEEVAAQAGWQCGTADEFVAAVERAHTADLPRFDPGVRSLYERYYSFDAARERLARIMGLERAS